MWKWRINREGTRGYPKVDSEKEHHTARSLNSTNSFEDLTKLPLPSVTWRIIAEHGPFVGFEKS
jgi:hypothetical protein